ncbi:nitroreductase/quinone reductase family protein [Kineosporia sp. A_224]|uniref:nitroreductase/quinone reductase family protein n=1 Tax=Kineosporia sp. A_224 TaxID=1962180 RepID=UPI0018EA08A3|nr:nitroreductase/quinone reductase family protein [Kineosporia sp. A_224]
MSRHPTEQAPQTMGGRRGWTQRLYGVKRWLYRGGRPQRLARGLNRLWAFVFAAGWFSPGNAMTLEVRGRRTGKTIAFPVVVAEHDGGRYLVSMLGEDANWVQNVRAADGQGVLRRHGAEQVRLVEVAPADRAPILRAYLDAAPGARPHIPVDRRAPLEEFDRIADQYPAFMIAPATPAEHPSQPAGQGYARAPVELSAHLSVRPGQLDGFRRQAGECIRLTRELDTGTLRYDWFLRDDGTACEVREAYTGPAALAEHRHHIAPALQTMFERYADDHEMTLYADPNPQLHAQLHDLAEAHHMTDHVTWFTFLDGLEPVPRP